MKIEFHYQCDFSLEDEERYIAWLEHGIQERNFDLGAVAYIFTTDDALLQMNVEYLNHHDYTDIITFDYTEDNLLSGDLFISYDRVKENAIKFEVGVATEMRRVMAHGLLHLMGYNDKTQKEKMVMRSEENKFIQMFHVEQ